uniref:Aminotran_5 domain-containing protein n=1 Tax=Rhabditophanes sp. KR3021 TaxID=114890 RepID=A0AC35TGT1_9BILA
MKAAPPIYVDYNSTTPLLDEVKQTIITALDNFGNPSSTHYYGSSARKCVEDARMKVGKMVNTCAEKIFFTSGGTESNHWVIWSAIFGNGHSGGGNIVISAVEHPSIQKPLEEYEKRDWVKVKKVGMNGGVVDLEMFEDAIDKDTRMVSIMMANNETGVFQPLREIVVIVRKKELELGTKIIIHSDAAQVIGKSSVDIEELGIDALTIVGHKFYGPKIGAVALSPYTKMSLEPMIFGGGQERDLRAGTENIPMIAGLGRASMFVANLTAYDFLTMQQKRDYLENQLLKFMKDSIVVNFRNSRRLVNTSSICFPKLKTTSPILLNSCEKFVASVGAACHSENNEGCIMMECGLSEKDAQRCVRISIGFKTSYAELDVVVSDIYRHLACLEK